MNDNYFPFPSLKMDFELPSFLLDNLPNGTVSTKAFNMSQNKKKKNVVFSKGCHSKESRKVLSSAEMSRYRSRSSDTSRTSSEDSLRKLGLVADDDEDVQQPLHVIEEVPMEVEPTDSLTSFDTATTKGAKQKDKKVSRAKALGLTIEDDLAKKLGQLDIKDEHVEECSLLSVTSKVKEDSPNLGVRKKSSRAAEAMAKEGKKSTSPNECVLQQELHSSRAAQRCSQKINRKRQKSESKESIKVKEDEMKATVKPLVAVTGAKGERRKIFRKKPSQVIQGKEETEKQKNFPDPLTTGTDDPEKSTEVRRQSSGPFNVTLDEQASKQVSKKDKGKTRSKSAHT